MMSETIQNQKISKIDVDTILLVSIFVVFVICPMLSVNHIIVNSPDTNTTDNLMKEAIDEIAKNTRQLLSHLPKQVQDDMPIGEIGVEVIVKDANGKITSHSFNKLN